MSRRRRARGDLPSEVTADTQLRGGSKLLDLLQVAAAAHPACGGDGQVDTEELLDDYGEVFVADAVDIAETPAANCAEVFRDGADLLRGSQRDEDNRFTRDRDGNRKPWTLRYDDWLAEGAVGSAARAAQYHVNLARRLQAMGSSQVRTGLATDDPDMVARGALNIWAPSNTDPQTPSGRASACAALFQFVCFALHALLRAEPEPQRLRSLLGSWTPAAPLSAAQRRAAGQTLARGGGGGAELTDAARALQDVLDNYTLGTNPLVPLPTTANAFYPSRLPTGASTDVPEPLVGVERPPLWSARVSCAMLKSNVKALNELADNAALRRAAAEVQSRVRGTPDARAALDRAFFDLDVRQWDAGPRVTRVPRVGATQFGSLQWQAPFILDVDNVQTLSDGQPLYAFPQGVPPDMTLPPGTRWQRPRSDAEQRMVAHALFLLGAELDSAAMPLDARDRAQLLARISDDMRRDQALQRGNDGESVMAPGARAINDMGDVVIGPLAVDPRFGRRDHLPSPDYAPSDAQQRWFRKRRGSWALELGSEPPRMTTRSTLRRGQATLAAPPRSTLSTPSTGSARATRSTLTPARATLGPRS